MVDSQLPAAVNKLPDKLTEFKDKNDKAQYVSLVLQVSTSAMTLADDKWTQFLYPQAQTEYLVAIDGFMQLLRLTTDDPNF